jgi:purine-binding chemotaxis protein CheW
MSMTESLTLALVRIGRINLAISAALVDEVMAGPVELSEFPHAAPHVLGAFARRGVPVPVIDIAALLNPGAGAERPVDFVLIIRHSGGRFAIQVDEVKGVVVVERETITELELRSAQGEGLFSRLYTPADGGRVSVVLDLDAVLATQGVRSAVELRTAGGDGADEAVDQSAGDFYVLFRAGGACFALNTAAARRVERYPDMLDSQITHPFLRGFHRVRGNLMSVVDVAALLGMPEGVHGASARNILVMRGAGASSEVALCIDELLAFRRVGEAEIEPVSGDAGFARGECLCGSFIHDGKLPVLVLNTDVFWEAVQVLDGGALQDVAGTADEAGTASAMPVHHLVYKAGGSLLATELVGLEAVAKLPPDYVDLRQPGRALVGMGSRNGRALTLIDLGMLLGAAPVAINDDRRVLVTASGQGLFGYVVESVNFMESAVAEPLPHPDRQIHGLVPPFSRMIRTHGENRDRAACVLDLAALAATSENV